jgi:hypothetical protein
MQNAGHATRSLLTKLVNSPTTLSGNNYLIVLVKIDSSTILVEPIKNRSNSELTRAYSMLMSSLHKAGVAPCRHALDNEISISMKALITEKYKMVYELVPPG